MEHMTWGGAYAADFIPYFAFTLSVALVSGAIALALTIVRSDARNAMLLIGGAVVLVGIVLGLSLVYSYIAGIREAGEFPAWAMNTLIWTGWFAAFGVIVVLTVWVTRNVLGDDPAAIFTALFRYGLYATGIVFAIWLLVTLVYAGSAEADRIADVYEAGTVKAVQSYAGVSEDEAKAILGKMQAGESVELFDKRVALAAEYDRGIIANILVRFLPVWIGLALIFAVSIIFKRRLGLYGKLFNSPIGMVGLALVLFWILTAFSADMIAVFDPLTQVSGLKNKLPGTPVPDSEGLFYYLGGDNLARDVFSRVVHGSRQVLIIAPAATLFAFMVGITLGLPAGYFGGRFDTILSFLANLVLAFPVILLFYLLVTPEIRSTGIPIVLAAVLFLFPIIFFVLLFRTKFFTQPQKLMIYMVLTLVLGFWAYSGLAFNSDPLGVFRMDPNLLNIFVSVVFVNSPTVFRIVRGLTMDIKTRDYVAAAQTRGEGPWYIMLWEILPNARGPLIVDFCLRIGYTTILLGTLGFFGLGVSPESPDWGSTINDGRKLLSVYPHPALPPAISLMSLVLGLNLLADGLREQSLKD